MSSKDSLPNHQRPHNNQRPTRRPGRDTRKNRREENRHKKRQPSDDRRQPRLASLRNTGGAFDEGGDGRRAHERAHADAERVDAVRDRGVFEVERDGVAEAGEFGHGVEGSVSRGGERGGLGLECL